MSDLVKANPILAQYVPKPTKGFATFGYQQGAQNVVEQQEATTALNAELGEVKTSETNLKTAQDELTRKKEEHTAKVAERQKKESEKATLTNEVNTLNGQVSQARTDLAAAQARVQAAQQALQAAQAEAARRAAEAAQAEAARRAAEAAQRVQAPAYQAPAYQAPIESTYAPITPVQETMYIPPVAQSRGVPSGVASIQPTMATVAPPTSTYTPQQVAQKSAFAGNPNVKVTNTPEQLAKISSQVESVLKNVSKEDFLRGFKYG